MPFVDFNGCQVQRSRWLFPLQALPCRSHAGLGDGLFHIRRTPPCHQNRRIPYETIEALGLEGDLLKKEPQEITSLLHTRQLQVHMVLQSPWPQQ